MKKDYTKPMVYIEQFKLSQSIAAGCNTEGFGGTPNQDNTSVCGWTLEGLNFFNGGTGCEMGEFPGFCYNAPDGGMIIFAFS